MVPGLDTVSGGRGRVSDGWAVAASTPLGLHLKAWEPACIWGEKREEEVGNQAEPDMELNVLLCV